MRCEHREWLPDDDYCGSGEQCPNEATHRSCVPFINTPTCKDHKCRCAKPLVKPPPLNIKLYIVTRRDLDPGD